MGARFTPDPRFASPPSASSDPPSLRSGFHTARATGISFCVARSGAGPATVTSAPAWTVSTGSEWGTHCRRSDARSRTEGARVPARDVTDTPDLSRVRRVLVIRHPAPRGLPLTTPPPPPPPAGPPPARVDVLVSRGVGAPPHRD